MEQDNKALNKSPFHISEISFQALVQYSADLLAVINDTGEFLYVSPSHEISLGHQRDDLIGRNIFDFIHPDDMTSISDTFKQLLLTVDSINDRRFRFRHRNGSWRWLDSVCSNQMDNPDVSGIVINSRDITESLISDTVLRENKQKLRILSDASEEGVVIIGEDRIIEVNPAMNRIFGYSGEELLGRSYRELIVEKTDNAVQKGITSSIAPQEITCRRKDGALIWCQLVVKDLKSDGDSMQIALFRDISELKWTEDSLRHSEEKYRTIVESSPFGIQIFHLVADDTLVMIGANIAADRILGIDNSQYIGKTIDEDIPPLSGPEIAKKFIRVAEQGFPLQTSVIQKTEEDIQSAFEVIVFRTSPGKIVVMFHDITARVKAEVEIKQNKEMLEEKVLERTQSLKIAHDKLLKKERLAILGQLVAYVGHEVRNPLGTIRAALHSISEAIPDDIHDIDQAITIAERNIVRCDTIINDLLDFARTTSVNREMIELDSWLQQYVKQILIPTDIEFRLDLDAGIQLLFDPRQLQRALINVVNNAIYAMDEYAEGNILILRTRCLSDRVELSIQDNGLKIPSEMNEDIFDPLYNMETFGIGLGLLIVQSIMHLHGGDVDIVRPHEGGTKVILWFPLLE